ncbi:MAG: hypothetical protein QM750_03390 [Rubrivivax sp.]
MNDTRRRWLIAGAATLSLRDVHSRPYTSKGDHKMLDDTMIDAAEPRFDPVPRPPARPTPGKPGDFSFLDGRWHIRHLKRRTDHWDRFDGEARCWTILGGVGHVEELLVPVRDFSGLGLRMLDVPNRQWSDHWVNAKSGVVTTPGQLGSFENGAGLFASTYEDDGKAVLTMGIWDCIGPGVCRWRQVYSSDGGKTWSHDWVMHWRRAA